MAIAHLIVGVLLCFTVIGIPLGVGNFKLAAVACLVVRGVQHGWERI